MIKNSKQRAYLKGLAMNMTPIIQIGKSSVTPELTQAVEEALEARELIKISVLQNCLDDPRQMAEVLAERTHADVVLADAVWSESTYGQAQSLDMKNWQYPSEELNRQIKDTALKMNKKLVSGPIHSSDVFYHEADANDVLRKMVDEEGLLCVEMESFALFHNAEVLGRNAACLLTISDSLVTGEELDADARATAFAEMVELALEAAIAV